jgi:hypothetical protein
MIKAAAWGLVNAVETMLHDWAEADEETRNRDLCQPLCQAAEDLREKLEDAELAEALNVVFLSATSADDSIRAVPGAQLSSAHQAARLIAGYAEQEIIRRSAAGPGGNGG